MVERSRIVGAIAALMALSACGDPQEPRQAPKPTNGPKVAEAQPKPSPAPVSPTSVPSPAKAEVGRMQAKVVPPSGADPARVAELRKVASSMDGLDASKRSEVIKLAMCRTRDVSGQERYRRLPQEMLKAAGEVRGGTASLKDCLQRG